MTKNNQTTFEINSPPVLWYIVIVAILFLSILRGIRFPNIWSYTHFLFNYEFGLVKRGLIGEIIQYFDSSWLSSYHFFLIVSLFIFMINMVLLLLLIRDFIYSKNWVLVGCSVIFVSSLAIVFLSHSIGYFDHIGLFITLLAVRMNGFFKKILFLLQALTFALFVHEAIVIMFFPVLFMSLLFDIKMENVKTKLSLLALFSAFIMILTLFISNATIEKQQAQQMYNQLQTETGYTLRRDAFHVLHRRGEDNLQIMGKIWSKKRYISQFVDSVLVTLPVLFLFLSVMFYLLKRENTNIYLIILASLAPLSPLVLHGFGWDMHRWNTLAITTSFIMLYVVHQSRKDRLITQSPHPIYPVFILAIFLNGISTIHLFDDYSVKSFPFVEHQTYLMDSITRKESFPDLPEK